MRPELLPIAPCLEFPPSEKARVASAAAAVTTNPQPSPNEEVDDALPVLPITLTNLVVTALLRREPSHLVVPPRFIPKDT